LHTMSDAEYMRIAIQLAKDGVAEGLGGPFGAIVVKDGQIIGQGQNRVIADNDPTAHAEVRARRRHAELRARGLETTYETVLADVHERDARDTGRSSAPLLQAPDAVMIDTSDLSIEDAIATAIRAVQAKRN
jgi:deoxycytidylate deaminase